jgi:hypothetical protein
MCALSQIQVWLAKRSLFRSECCAYLSNRSTKATPSRRRSRPKEATMNIFKGLLFLHGYANPADYQAELDDQVRRQFGAGTAASEFVAPLGNRAASQRTFRTPSHRAAPLPDAGCVVGGCG